ncbi:MAG: hypothetical protein PHI27_10555 [Eubacteriales bacterium]|nr:hypothetical protein [Eubacteriales bacterium]MDD3882681.1 hypothetical protein [Eubacteriales bacterium]MDD4512747.1 hypothetical protein [Eubacteriales bacterium]
MKLDKKLYPWADCLSDDDFISDTPSYTGGEFLNLFEDRLFTGADKSVGALRYYVYDPTKHGFPASGKYPVIFALHGAGGSLVGKTAVGWAGAETFASPEYQRRMGGAYIVCPLANEKADKQGAKRMCWTTPIADGGLCGYPQSIADALQPFMERRKFIVTLLGVNSVYTASLLRLLSEALASFTSCGKVVLFGSSAGGYAAWRMLITAPERFCAALLIGAAYLPSPDELEKVSAAGVKLLIYNGVHDELVDYSFFIEPILPYLRKMPRVQLLLPELLRNADGGVASNIAGGVQMGQHCGNNIVSQDLMYLTGEPMADVCPRGVTGWIKDVCGE